MGGYIANFTVYTMAMIGLICFAFFVYKKITDGSFHGPSTKSLNIEESLTLSPRKTLHIIKAGNERFLIASDAERTTLISKLNTNNSATAKIIKSSATKQNKIENIEEISDKEKYISQEKVKKRASKDKLVRLEPIKQTNTRNEDKLSAMKEMARKINQL